MCRDPGFVCEEIPQCIVGFRRVGGVREDCQLVPVDLPVLLIHNVVDGIPQSESGQQQGTAARHPDHGHNKALFVPEQVARRDLDREGKPAPYEGNMLQPDALARAGCLRAHEGGRAGAELRPRCPQRCQQDTANRDRRRPNGDVGAEGRCGIRQEIHHAVGTADGGGEQPIAFSVPIWVRFSSTSRVMVVSATSRATRKKNTGKM